MTTSLVETCQIPPTADEVVEELSLPLTSFDIFWLHFHPIRRLLFYEYPCSKPYFLDTLVPKLKHSLSLTLKHYLPVAGNLIYPEEKKPVFRYVAGDSVSLTIAESGNDFDNLIGNHARNADQFYDFVPQIPPVKDEHDYKKLRLIALQVTLFPGRGICIGLANLHSLGDASSIIGFMSAWASITKFGGVLKEKAESLMPIFDRSLIKDPMGADAIYWKVIGEIPLMSSTFPLPTDNVRATFILHPPDIQRLKDLVLLAKKLKVSSFVVTTCYIWSCLVKSGDAIGEEVDGNVLESFIFPVDARARINPPLPPNYFGNFLGCGLAKMEHEKLVSDEGFMIAVEAVAEDMKNRVNNKDELLKGRENWLSESTNFIGTRVLGISGSPKFDLYSANFGWGRARKLEVLSIDEDKHSMSLCKSSDLDGGLEVGLSLPKERMEAFTSIFTSGLGLSLK